MQTGLIDRIVFMSKSFVPPQELQALFVECAQSDKYSSAPTRTQNLVFTLAPTPSDVEEMMAFRRFDCVLVRINPSCRENLEQMDAVRDLVLKHAVPLVSMSTFNVNWIENLMTHLGVYKHFRQFPTHDELSKVVIEYQESVNGQTEGVVQ